MAATANPGVFVQAQATAKSPSPSIPWYIWIGVAAVTSSSIGGLWDVSWHRSIGRDTFWTPAHMMIYLCGVLAGIVGMFLGGILTDLLTRHIGVRWGRALPN